MTMIYIRPFSPVGETVSGSSGTIALDRTGVGTQSIRILNAGSDTASVQLVQIVDGTTLYEGPEIPLLSGSVETFLLPNKVTHAVIVSGSGPLYFTTGESA